MNSAPRGVVEQRGTLGHGTMPASSSSGRTVASSGLGPNYETSLGTRRPRYEVQRSASASDVLLLPFQRAITFVDVAQVEQLIGDIRSCMIASRAGTSSAAAIGRATMRGGGPPCAQSEVSSSRLDDHGRRPSTRRGEGLPWSKCRSRTRRVAEIETCHPRVFEPVPPMWRP